MGAIATGAAVVHRSGMRGLGIMAAAAALIGGDGAGQPAVQGAGERYEITRHYQISEETNEGSQSSASGHDGLLERVVAVRGADMELEYDLPREADQRARTAHWQFPARVLRRVDGTMSLLNRGEMEARLARGLAAAGWSRDVCGRWIFTWNAFRIECEPESVIPMIAAVDLRSADLREGGLYRDAEAREPVRLARVADQAGRARLAAVMEVDPDAVRRAAAEADAAAGEIARAPVTLEAALRERARDRVSGTIEVTFDIDGSGTAFRRTRVTRMQIVRPGGVTETRTGTETVERRRVAP